MAAQRVTIREVANEAGVSITTVSHALNDKGEVDPATRRRVVDVAERLGYRASAAARALRGGRSGTITLMVPATGSDPADIEMLSLDYYMRLAIGAAQRAFLAGCSLLLAPRPTNLRELRQLNTDGAIICDPGRADPRVDAFAEWGVPVVTVERDQGRPDAGWFVAGDNRNDTGRLLDHLAAAGAERIALLAPEPDWAWAAEATDAYSEWASRRGRDVIVEQTSMSDLERSAHDRASALLRSPRRPDAILALAEHQAAAAARAARELGVRVPGELLIASGVDSHPLVQHDPPITALDLRPELRGGAAAELLLARVEGDRTASTRVIPGELIVRASTTRRA
ncbi:LacI family DNA-binding transcriptional regulator [Pseudonocardia acaciae]|uniref:LacI family DNA-binding transcriptional regulator n=1 Tax=Pseudonocardia acaciae TaxID=551276 RepID=UPI000490DC2C|nr:LacI family DNA-binding transcriptional regulator [Pseudonocardia acaciae]